MQSSPKQPGVPGVVPPKVAGAALPAKPIAVGAVDDWSGGWQNLGSQVQAMFSFLCTHAHEKA